MEWFDDHKKLFLAALLLFVGLTVLVAIIPALKNERINQALPGAEPLSQDAIAGKYIYIANGCVGCHTQQVRNVDMDKMWGQRPSMAADYALIRRTDFWRNTATLMGTERTGPDLTNVGTRQGNKEWNLTHLFNPRILVKESVMPAYPWLFEIKKEPAQGDVVVNVPAEYLKGIDGKVVATKEALQLVAYLQSLKQAKLPDQIIAPEFLYKKAKTEATAGSDGAATEIDGAELYGIHCQACHQANGEGLPGAFPPLKGSKVVLDDNIDLYVDIIMNGYTARESEGYGPMLAVGTNANLSPEEVAAIMNHERTSWGNNAKKVTPDDVKKVLEAIKSEKK
ncbi:MAG TPA: cbb3-type cytochrome c oxidase subunit II [Niabella sp.]|jgi:cytochrome c oxidase cbb3-type subunit 2|nr:cytochrome c [Chitinophagaceae bacterium]HRO83341.1 cbb3-type cytochrome c oxidase subunit II [Niabella sp.]